MKQTEKTQRTVSKILDAAIVEFGKNGYAGGTVNQICSAGISKGLIYHNFEGKDDLYLVCLDQSCQMLLKYLQEQDRTRDLESYMTARRDFFRKNPNEARIIFEALLSPPAHLSAKIGQALSGFNELNEKMYSKTLDSIVLRDGISRQDAVSYFHLMQLMLNGYFSSPAFQNADPSERVETHEMIVSKLLECMLYGIAKGDI